MEPISQLLRYFCVVIVLAMFILSFYLPYRVVIAQEEEETSTYGIDWFLFPDDLGGLHYANLTSSTVDNKMLDALERKVYFHLYTQRNMYTYEELYTDSETDSEYFIPEDATKFITHGWMSSGSSSTVIDIKDAYLSNRTVNAIVVDWHEIADELIYLLASQATRYVGYRVAEMARTIIDRYNVTANQFHLIGHSLGAHVMGHAGKNLHKNNITAGRITGLDPAKPLFEFPFLLFGGLSSDDADFVDTIHTCGGVLGYARSHGHADFYPNNGRPAQPGCDGLIELADACSHARSHQYFTESINSVGFVAYPCGSYNEYTAGNCRNGSVIMGDMLDPDARGDYYLRTNSEPKYARGNDVND